MGRESRSRAARRAGPEILLRGAAPLGRPLIGHGRGKKKVVVGSTRTPLVCKWWRGGPQAQEELRRLGITEIRAGGTPLPGENTLARECGLGAEFVPTLLMFGICKRGDPTAPGATLACHAAQAAGVTTTPCKDQRLVAREDFDIERALAESQRVSDALAAALRRRAGEPPGGRF